MGELPPVELRLPFGANMGEELANRFEKPVDPAPQVLLIARGEHHFRHLDLARHVRFEVAEALGILYRRYPIQDNNIWLRKVP